MIKSYSRLGIDHCELEKINVGGILHSSTQIWFLKCRARTSLNSNAYSTMYEMTCSKEFDIIQDYEVVCKLYCKMMEDAASLNVILRNFIPTDKYGSTELTKHSVTPALSS